MGAALHLQKSKDGLMEKGIGAKDVRNKKKTEGQAVKI